MNVLDDFLKTSINKSDIQTVKDITGSMHLVDFGVIESRYDDGTCDVVCIKETKNGSLLRFHGVEILYPCGIQNAQTNQMCLLVNPYSSVYRTYDIENPDFMCDHDIRCIKAIPISNSATNIFAGIDDNGDFKVANEYTLLNIGKWSAYFGAETNGKAGVSIYQDGTVIIDACNGKIHMLLHNIDGLALIHYDSNYYALEALVMKPDGEKFNLFFCSQTFTFTKISDILDIGEDKWKRIEKTGTDGVFHIYTGPTSTGADRHLATSEDLKALWTAFKNHVHGYSWTDGGGSGDTAAVTSYPANPKQVAGIVVKDGADA